MITNPNYRPQRYIDPRDPRYIAPEGYCPTCETETTQITAKGECRECGTEVVKAS